jgi:poly-gamma-glutamate synthesis protein (capsule biosynthesis protein)
MALGDMMFHGRVSEYLMTNFRFPFLQSQPYLSQADIVFANLETMITNQRRAEAFVGVKALKYGNVSAVNLCHNHMFDYGTEGVETTINLLQKESIGYVGIGKKLSEARRPLVKEVGGGRIGFLSYCSASTVIDKKHDYVVCSINPDLFMEDIKNLRRGADWVVVTMHEGLCSYPSPQYRIWAKKAVDAGADIVVGHHPHIINGIEQYGNAVIAYGLGNFIAPFEGKAYQQSFILDCVLEQDKKVQYKAVPIWINSCYQPEIAEGENRTQIESLLTVLSDKLRTNQNDSDYYAFVNKSYWPMLYRDVCRSFRAEGMNAIMRKMKKIRFRHLGLLFRRIMNGFHNAGN